MTRKEAIRQTEQENTLLSLGFTRDEADALRRISMRLHRWFELECGDSNTYGSWAIERDETTEIAYMVRHAYGHGQHQDKTITTKIADRETGARKRLDNILRERNTRENSTNLSAYVQTDPRGAALYILRPDDVPAGADVSSYYSRGICIY